MSGRYSDGHSATNRRGGMMSEDQQPTEDHVEGEDYEYDPPLADDDFEDDDEGVEG